MLSLFYVVRWKNSIQYLPWRLGRGTKKIYSSNNIILYQIFLYLEATELCWVNLVRLCLNILYLNVKFSKNRNPNSSNLNEIEVTSIFYVWKFWDSEKKFCPYSDPPANTLRILYKNFKISFYFLKYFLTLNKIKLMFTIWVLSLRK